MIGPHGLRRAVEQLLPDFFPLKSGLTTDTPERFARIVIAHCMAHCRPLLPDASLELLLISDDGDIYR